MYTQATYTTPNWTSTNTTVFSSNNNTLSSRKLMLKVKNCAHESQIKGKKCITISHAVSKSAPDSTNYRSLLHQLKKVAAAIQSLTSSGTIVRTFEPLLRIQIINVLSVEYLTIYFIHTLKKHKTHRHASPTWTTTAQQDLTSKPSTGSI